MTLAKGLVFSGLTSMIVSMWVNPDTSLASKFIGTGIIMCITGITIGIARGEW